MEAALDPQDVERARTFWAEENIDQVFTGVFEYLGHLKRALKKNTATDREYVQALKLLEALDCSPPTSSQDSSVVQVVIGSGELLPADFCPSPSSSSSSSSSSPSPSNGPLSSSAPPAGGDELLPPLTPVALQYEPHTCCKACLTSVPHSETAIWGQNPLKVPLLCGFKRLSAQPLTSSPRDEDSEGAEPVVSEDWDVLYKAPCGLCLRNHDDVMHFLLATGSYDLLQADFFTFNPTVRLDPPVAPGPQRPEVDLSRGAEPTPVELCMGEGGARPPEFRYRKERWPHGCFLSRGPTLFNTCCDCTDGCSTAKNCACVAMTTGGSHYNHNRLEEPVPTGVFECGPWCGCDRARCQNRLVQRGIRVRLQVFQTEGRGWGVRCRDDLDRGTFVCIYAGVILRRVHAPSEPPPPKLTRADLPSDDEVEVVTEWLAPPVLEGRSNLVESTPTSPPLHVPVIQRPADPLGSTPRDREEMVLVSRPEATPITQEKTVTMTTGCPREGVNGTKTSTKSLKRAMKGEDVNFLDASKEGNVSRFFNHSCRPNLFIQNVFTDSHDPAFPVIAFFTSRVVKAGTELTWDYSSDTDGEQEVACLCGSDGCRGRFTVEENLCEMCELQGETQ
ncbi:histone-lysine N-methyltransferase SETDB2 isoform X2 [Cheilinus undulatus]|uniref:histone-lysine N-methyltransferase SETDB2 isoform X2 n=1 Tax=Cheilinus undulatus TaxID=241271 RepID=UPI001BD620BF|nr:histone-lysine N-methyltransferase SETDB2 isoform X2 [Cheilinus undulatus]